ncbi:MAG TPA: hypothetical protein VEK11_17675 [Thermoanaerobaculia bacterium]|nr:hypothetical protein [Thermoanaerobaculia bacterium]
MRAFLLIALVVFAGCNGESDPTSPDGVLPFTQVAKEKNSGITQRRAEVIALQSRWVQVWDEMMSTRSPKPPVPQVDFETKILILAAYGETGDACRDVEIERVDRRSGALEVSIADKRRAPNCPVCPPVTAQPVHVVSVERAATGVNYTWLNRTDGCP